MECIIKIVNYQYPQAWAQVVEGWKTLLSFWAGIRYGKAHCFRYWSLFTAPGALHSELSMEAADLNVCHRIRKWSLLFLFFTICGKLSRALPSCFSEVILTCRQSSAKPIKWFKAKGWVVNGILKIASHWLCHWLRLRIFLVLSSLGYGLLTHISWNTNSGFLLER